MGMLAWQVTVTHTETHSYSSLLQFILHISAWHPKWTFWIIDRIMQFPHFNPSKACHCPENKSTDLSTVCKSAQGCCSNLIFVPLPFAPLMELLPSLHSLSVLPLRAFVHALLLNTLPKIFTWLTSVHQGFCSEATSSEHSSLIIYQK